MKRSFRDKWCKELRSGKYRQGRVRLMHNDGTRCCLGVAYACEGIEPVRTEWGFAFRRRLNFPDDETLERWGLPAWVARELYKKNDECLCSFAEIADIIEAMPAEEG